MSLNNIGSIPVMVTIYSHVNCPCDCVDGLRDRVDWSCDPMDWPHDYNSMWIIYIAGG